MFVSNDEQFFAFSPLTENRTERYRDFKTEVRTEL